MFSQTTVPIKCPSCGSKAFTRNELSNTIHRHFWDSETNKHDWTTRYEEMEQADSWECAYCHCLASDDIEELIEERAG